MRKVLLILLVVFLLGSFYLHLLGLMRIVPIYISSPLLFLSICAILLFLNGKNRFRGFH